MSRLEDSLRKQLRRSRSDLHPGCLLDGVKKDLSLFMSGDVRRLHWFLKVSILYMQPWNDPESLNGVIFVISFLSETKGDQTFDDFFA